MTVNAIDVAAQILKQLGSMPALKLQKLVYYCQAWSLVWDDAPLFNERIEAWVNGPVIPHLYAAHRGQYIVEALTQGNPSALSSQQGTTIKNVLDFYGDKETQWLVELTHLEEPWKQARKRVGLAPLERGTEEISQAEMAEYYSSLVTSNG